MLVPVSNLQLFLDIIWWFHDYVCGNWRITFCFTNKPCNNDYGEYGESSSCCLANKWLDSRPARIGNTLCVSKLSCCSKKTLTLAPDRGKPSIATTFKRTLWILMIHQWQQVWNFGVNRVFFKTVSPPKVPVKAVVPPPFSRTSCTSTWASHHCHVMFCTTGNGPPNMFVLLAYTPL